MIAVRLGIGEARIPLAHCATDCMKSRKTRNGRLSFANSLRGYEAALVIEANGGRTVKVMEGGSWHGVTREK